MSLRSCVLAIAAGAALATGAAAQEVEVVLAADADTSIFSDIAANNSNGAGPDLYSGRVGPAGGTVRQRSLVRFDLSAIPADATIISAEVTLNLVQPGPFVTPDIYTLSRVTSPWGEGGAIAGGGQGAPATPDDATWNAAFFPGVPWGVPGGDFVAESSAAVEVGTVGNVDVTWLGGSLADDVAAWVAGIEPNHGWILIGNEVDPWSARKFGARENDPSRQPRLTVVYEAGPAPCLGDFDGSGAIDFGDVLSLIANWGPCDDCPQDVIPDGQVDFSDLLVLLSNFGGCAG